MSLGSIVVRWFERATEALSRPQLGIESRMALFLERAFPAWKMRPGSFMAFDPVTFAVQLAVFVISSLISRALAPKPKRPEPGKAEIPVVKEGKAPVEIFGAVWRKESFLAGWKQLDPPEPIKLKQGKK